jgi:hypothetical protein
MIRNLNFPAMISVMAERRVCDGIAPLVHFDGLALDCRPALGRRRQ